jgi:hypothetical protein
MRKHAPEIGVSAAQIDAGKATVLTSDPVDEVNSNAVPCTGLCSLWLVIEAKKPEVCSIIFSALWAAISAVWLLNVGSIQCCRDLLWAIGV